MRELIAKILTLATGLVVCLLVILFALIQNMDNNPEMAAAMEATDSPGWSRQIPSRLIHDQIDIQLGKVLYTALKCRTCHSVAGEGNQKSPLDGAGNRLDAEEIRQWVLNPGEFDPDIRKPDYNYLSEDQVNLLVKYVLSLNR